MIFKENRQKLNNSKATVTYVKKEDSDFYLTKGLSDDQVKKLDLSYKMPMDKLRRIKDIIPKTAEEFNIKHKDAELRDPQMLPVLMSAINPRLFLGDSPGLGKTIMSLGMYSYYKYNQKHNGKEPKKIIVVTEGNHVIGFQKEWLKFGVPLLPLTNSSAGIKRSLKNNNIEDFDGVIINWDGLKTNGFLNFYLRNKGLFNYIILDETHHLLNPKNIIYQTVDAMVNSYEGGLSNVVMLNGTPFEKSIYDFYYQFNILEPKLIPSKKFIEDRYVIRQGKEVYMQQFGAMSNARRNIIKRNIGVIVDYKHQEELRERLKYYYIGRKKSDFSDSLPEQSHILHGVEMTKAQEKLLSTGKGNISLLNSPNTSDPKAKFDRTTSPKLDMVIDFAKETREDRPLIYVYNKEAQKTFKELLEKEGFKVAILNGECSTEDKGKILQEFNEDRTLDMLIFNLETAMNIPTSDRIIFYDIPTMAYRTQQIKARIDRNNYTDRKFYDFFCYLWSPEMINIVKFAYFREDHSNKFTGKDEATYKELVEQLETYYESETLQKASDLSASIERNKALDSKLAKQQEDELGNLLNILG